MKDKLQKMLNAKNTRKAELVQSIEASESIDDIKRFSAELDKLNGEIRDIEGMLNDLPTEEEARTAAVNAPIPSVVKTEAAEERKAPAEVKTDDSKVYRSLGEQLVDIKRRLLVMASLLPWISLSAAFWV